VKLPSKYFFKMGNPVNFKQSDSPYNQLCEITLKIFF
jgi:hypothetical protein